MASNRYPGVYRRGKTWSFRAQFGDGADRWGVSGSGYPSAKAAHDAKIQAIQNARPLHGIKQRPSATLTLADYLDAWVLDHGRTVKASTLSSYESKVAQIKRSPIAQRRLRSLTEADYRRLIGDLRAQAPKHTTLMAKVTILAVALNAAVRAGLIPHHPLGAIKISRSDERFEPRVWDVATVQKFLAHRRAANDPLYHAWLLAVLTGLRRGELHGLRWGDVDLDRRVLHVRRQRAEVRGKIIETAPKTTASEAPVYLDADLVETLRAVPRTSEYVVNDPRTGRPYTSMRLFRADWIRAQRYANVPRIRFHDLRHTSASLLAHVGVPLVLAQQRLRHWSQAMTARYTHALDGAAPEVADKIAAALVAGPYDLTKQGEQPAAEPPLPVPA